MSSSSSVPHFNITLEGTNVEAQFSTILERIKPHWKKTQIVYQGLIKGVSAGALNTMVKCYRNSEPLDAIMIRIPHVGLNEIINRNNEVHAMKFYQHKKSSPKVLAVFNNGFCYEYAHGEILTYKKVIEEPFWRKAAEKIASLHSEMYEDEVLNKQTLSYIDVLKRTLAIYPEKMINPKNDEQFQAEMPDKAAMTAEVDIVLDHVTKLGSPVVLCHNDTRGENIIWNAKNDSLVFVDWETVGYNYQAMEIAAHFKSLAGLNPPDFSLIPDEKFQSAWVRAYLEKYYDLTGRNKEAVTDKEVQRIFVQTTKFYLLMVLFGAILGPAWESLFSDIPEGQVDVMGFTTAHIREYYKEKTRILALQMPD